MSRAAKTSNVRLTARLFKQARPYWPHLCAVIALNLAALPLALLQPLPLKIVADQVIGGEPLPEALAPYFPASLAESSNGLLAAAVGLLLAVGLISFVRGQAADLLQTYTGEKLVLDFRSRLFRRLQRLSFSYHDRAGSADAVYRLYFDADCIQEVFIAALAPLVGQGVPMIGVAVVLFMLDWQLAAIALSAAPPLAVLAYAFGRRLRRQWATVSELDSSAMSTLQTSISELRVVKAFNQEEGEARRFADRSDDKIRSMMAALSTGAAFRFFLGVVVTVATAAVLYVGALHVQDGRLTLGELLMVMAYLGQIFSPIRNITQTAAWLTRSMARAERAFAILDREPDIEDKPGARPIVRAEGRITLDGVSFAYQPERPVLRDIRLEIPAGTCVGVRGPTGSGKSTLLSLLMRFYDPQQGRILLDGVDVRDYRVEDLRRQFSLMLQEPVLFSASIRENIVYAREGASHAEIVEAARLAGVHEFISALPDGYDTQVGERGMSLSGGERQRISLARAFLRDAPILILDEPTSALDAATEAGVLEALERLLQGRTTFLVSHRPSALEHCTMVLEIDSGGRAQVLPAQCKGSV